MKADKVIGLVLVAFSGFMYYQADQLPPAMFGARGADLFPKILFTLLAACGAGLTIQAVLRERKAQAAGVGTGEQPGPGRAWPAFNEALKYYQSVIFAFLAFLAYVLLMYYLGYLISSLVFMPVLMWALGPRNKKAAVVTAATTLGVTLAIYYSFVKLLNVFLPAGSLF